MSSAPSLLWVAGTLAVATAGAVGAVHYGFAWGRFRSPRHAVGAALLVLLMWACLTSNPLIQYGLAGLHASRLEACRTSEVLRERYGQPNRIELSGGSSRLTYHLPRWQVPWRAWNTYALINSEGRIIAANADDWQP